MGPKKVKKKKTRVKVWLYEDTKLYMEGVIIGFDEYMNMVLDDAMEIIKDQRTPIGRILLKGDAITMLQYVYGRQVDVTHTKLSPF